MEGFDEFILEADLVDLPLKGRHFTWSNLEGLSMSQIDRFLVSEGWMNLWKKWDLESFKRWVKDGVKLHVLINKTLSEISGHKSIVDYQV